MITVMYDGLMLRISKVIADQFGLKNGSTIMSESLFWEVLGENARYNIVICQAAIAADKNQN